MKILYFFENFIVFDRTIITKYTYNIQNINTK